MRRLQLTRLNSIRLEGREAPPRLFVGDHCPSCDSGVIGVYTTKRTVATITRYLECRECGFKPEDNKIVETIRVGTTT
jgi:predicted RNA-binding Zn-ribbon protein involved in translation (DUF1610 family)